MNQITISEIQIVPVKPKNGLVAFVSFILNESLFVSSVAIYTRLENPDQYRLVYPSKQIGNKDTSILYPIKKEVGGYIEKQVSDQYNKLFKKCDEYVRYSDFNSTRS
jgi:hypothetical protein